MARKKRKAKFRAVSAIKEMARERIGSPPPQQVVPNRKKNESRPAKHKPTLEELLRDFD